jgi:hypothetical protein
MVIPKKICGCPFLWFVSFGQAKEPSGQKVRNKFYLSTASSAKPNEQSNFGGAKEPSGQKVMTLKKK